MYYYYYYHYHHHYHDHYHYYCAGSRIEDFRPRYDARQGREGPKPPRWPSGRNAQSVRPARYVVGEAEPPHPEWGNPGDPAQGKPKRGPQGPSTPRHAARRNVRRFCALNALSGCRCNHQSSPQAYTVN